MKKFLMACSILALGFQSVCGAPVFLKAGTIDPSNPPPATRTPTEISGFGTYLLQCDGQPSEKWLDLVRASGAVIRSYIPENAYVVQADAKAYRKLETDVPHGYLAPFEATWRIDDAIRETMARHRTTGNAGPEDNGEGMDADTIVCSILLFDREDSASVLERISGLDHCTVQRSSGKVIQAELTLEAIETIASWPEVHWVEKYVEPQLYNNVAVQAPRMNVQTVWPGGTTQLGLTGDGQIVAVADTGLDTGNLSTLHQDVRGRVLNTYALGRSRDWSDPHGHGTHVSGSILGNGARSDGTFKGVAYEASLVFQSTMDSSGSLTGIPADLEDLFDQAYNNPNGGARIHSDSWGSSQYGAYTTRSQDADSFMFQHPDMLIVFSAANDGEDYDEDGVIDSGSLGSPATAKNVLTVGASESYRTSGGGYSQKVWGTGSWLADFPVAPIRTDYISRPYDGEHQGMAAFSSRGPCDDGRIKPDIVAPGTDIISLRSSVSDKTGWGEYNDYYVYMGGTSMATPLVAGAAALVRQWLQENRGIANPDAATIKAVFLAGAKSLSPGQYGTGNYREIPATYPNNVEGWGQANLGNSLANGNGISVFDAQVIGNGETQTFKVTARSGVALNIVMAYTDAASSPSASRNLVNNLDMTVTTPSGTTLYPNSRSSSDTLNNVEGVRISSATAGEYTITVKGTSISTGMAPSLVGNRSQAIRYSLVVNGAEASSAVPAMPNDSFSSPETLSGNSGTKSGSNAGATLETSETRPSAAGGNVGASVWFKWTAPGNGTVTLDTAGSSFDTVLGVYTGSSVSSLSEIASNDDDDGVRTSKLTFTAVAGTTYRIAVYGYSSASGNYKLNWSFTASTVSYTVNYNLGGGTGGSHAPASATYGTAFYVSAPTKSGYTFTGWTVTSGLDTSTAKWGTTSSPSTSISSSSTKCVNGATGNVYFLNLRSTSGSVTLTANWTPNSSSNDSFSLPETLSGNTGSKSGSNVGATMETSERLPSAAGGKVGASLWFTWTAPGNGTMTLDTAGSSFDTVLGVFTGSSVSSLSEVTSNDDADGARSSLVTFTAVAGTTYRIAVYGYDSATGNYQLNWSFAPAVVSYSVNYNLDGGTGGSHVPTSATCGTAFYVSAPTKSGSTFAGWTVTSGLDTSTAKWGTTSSPATSISSSSTKCANGATGNVYFLNLRSTSGSVTLTANWTPDAATNDSFSSPVTLSGNSGSRSGSNVGATLETSETRPSAAGGNVGASVWFRWTAPGNGTLTLDTVGSSFDTVLGVYTGSSVSSLSEITSNDDDDGVRSSKVTFTAVAGTTYRIAVYGYCTYTGSIQLNWSFAAAAITYSVNYNLDGGTGGIHVPASGTYGTAFYVSAPSKSGYDFAGWTVTGGLDTSTAKWGTTSNPSTSISSSSTRCANGTTGDVYFLNLRSTSGSVTLTANWTPRGATKYAVCVGVNQYDSNYIGSYNWLNGCVPDATNIRQQITTLGEWTMSNVAFLTNSAAARDRIRSEITSAASKSVSGDTFLYYHSSHGGTKYLCAYDADYTASQLASDLARFRSGVKVVIMIDACHSASMFKAKGIKREIDFAEFAALVSSEIDAIRTREAARGLRDATPRIASSEIGWVTAADSDQYSWDTATGGAFTVAAIQGWTNGVCDNSTYGDRDGYANFYELWNYAKDIAIGHPGVIDGSGVDCGTTAQCTNTAVLKSAIAGRVGQTSPDVSNDSFSSPVTLAGNSGSRSGSSVGATMQPSESLPSAAGGYVGASVWFKWTAPGNGTMTLDTAGSSFDTVLGVYTGSSVSSLSEIASNDDYDGYSSRVTFTAVAGTTYRIAVYGYGSSSGSYWLNWSFSAAAITYSVNYALGNGVGGAHMPSSATYGSVFYVSAPTRSGYAFTGWMVTSGLDTSTARWGTTSNPNTPIASSSTKCANGTTGDVYFRNLRSTSGSVTLTAGWVGTIQRLWFDANGGTCAVASTNCTIGGKYGTLPVPTWSGHVFLGWYTDPHGGTRVQAGGTVTEEADRTVYARWTTVQTVTFDGNGGTPDRASQTFTIGQPFGTLPGATRSGHEFLGWYTEAEGGTRLSTNTLVKAVAQRTFYAHWRELPRMQRMTFDPNGGVCGSEWEDYTVGTPYTYLPRASRDRYAFLGWYTKASGGTRISEITEVPAVATRTVYAHWTPTRQWLLFDPNGGTCAVSRRDCVVGEVYEGFPVPSKPRNAFLGWFTAATGGSQVTTNSTVTQKAERTLYAHWTDRQVTTFDGNGGTPASRKTTNTIAAAYGTMPKVSWTDHVFLGWYTAAAGGSLVATNSSVTLEATRTLYAHWTTKQVTTFDGNGGAPEIQKTTNTIAKAFGKLPAATWAGHAFLGWYTEAVGGTKVSTNTPVKAVAERTFYAHWTDKQVTTFKGNGGSPASRKTTNTIAKAFGTLPTATWAGHAFLGWYTEAEGGTKVSTNTLVKAVAERTFYAHWTDRQVTTFNGNGGTPTSQKTTNTVATMYGTLPVVTWSNHVFLGWYTEATGGKRVYTNSTVTAEASRTLYAHWTAKQATTFDGNGGAPEVQVRTNTMGKAYGTMPKVSWSNHVFLGWYTTAKGGELITTNSLVTVAKTRRLYAHWTAKQATTFDGNGGTPEVQVRTNTMGKAYGTMPKVSWSNHVFLGWYTTAKGGEQVTASSTVTVAKTRTLYAHWTAKQTTTFDGNGGAPEVQVRTNTMGKAYGTMPKVSWSNHVFLGWYTTAKGGEQVTANSTVTVAKTRTLYAHWTAKQVTTFDGNGGTPEVQVRTNTMGKAYGTLPKVSWSNHVFLGWYTTAKGGEQVTANSIVTVAKVRTLYAHWTSKQVTTFDGNGGTPEVQVLTNTMGKAYGTLPKVSWADHVFLGWYTTAKGGEQVTANSTVTVAKARTLYAHWTSKQVTTFDGNGGTPPIQKTTNTIAKAFGKLPTATWAGHAFLGWYTEVTGGTKVSTNTPVKAVAERTFYAHWTDKQVTTFKGNGGSPASRKTTNTIAKAFGTLPTATWAGHAFLGWYTEAEGGTKVSTNTPVKAVAERTFYAHWTDKQVTTFNGNGGTPTNQKTTNTISSAYGTLPKVSWSNHAFLGWYTEATGGTRVYTNSTVTAVASRTLYAHWTAKQVTTFNGNGGTPEVQERTNTIGKVYGTLPKVSWSNHVFLGWYTTAKGGELVTTNSTVTATASRTLYAHWTAKQVTTFDGNGGTPAIQKTTNTIAKAFGKLPAATWAGHAFLGWYTEVEGGTRVSTNTPVKAVAERTFYAHWTDKQVTTFKGNGGSPKSQKTTNTIAKAFGKLPTATWPGHVFLGWYTEVEGGTRVSTNTPVKAVAERTFYAHWKDSKSIGKDFVISGMQVGGTAESGNNPAAVRALLSRGEICTLRFEVVAGVEYEIEWAPSLLEGWMPLERLVAEEDGQAEVEVELPAGAPRGFFRILSSGWTGDEETQPSDRQ